MITSNKPHISPTQVRMHGNCEQKWHFRYVMGIKTPPGFALIEGSGAHKAAEANNKQKIDSHVDLPVTQLQEIAADAIEKKVMEEGLELTKDEESRGRVNVLGEIKDSATLRVVPAYAAYVAPNIQPVVVEEEMRIELPDHPYDLFGIIDVADDKGVVRDLKIAGRAKSQREADDSTQLSWYHMAYESRFKEPPAGVALDVIVKTKVTKAQVLRSTRTDKDTEVLLRRVNNMIDHIRSGIQPKPAQEGDPLCSPKFCGYWNMCPYVNSTRRAAAEDME